MGTGNETGMQTIEFHYDFGSPNAYLVHRVIPAISAETGIQFDYVPILLGGVFKATGNVSPAVSLRGIRNKGEYQGIEMRRFCKRYGIAPPVPNPHFPVNTLKMMRGAVYARGEGFYLSYVDAMYRAMWERALDMQDDAVIRSALEDASLPVQQIVSAISEPAVKQELIDSTERSVERGTFGSPTFFVGDEIYFGKDKLRDALESAEGTGSR